MKTVGVDDSRNNRDSKQDYRRTQHYEVIWASSHRGFEIARHVSFNRCAAGANPCSCSSSRPQSGSGARSEYQIAWPLQALRVHISEPVAMLLRKDMGVKIRYPQPAFLRDAEIAQAVRDVGAHRRPEKLRILIAQIRVAWCLGIIAWSLLIAPAPLRRRLSIPANRDSASLAWAPRFAIHDRAEGLARSRFVGWVGRLSFFLALLRIGPWN